MSFSFKLKNNAAGAAKKSAPAKRKLLFDDDDEDVTSKAKAADGGQEIGELNFEDTLAPVKEPEKLAPRPKLKGVPAGPPTRKPKAREGDPTATGNSASMREADRRAKEAVELDASVYEYDRVYDALHAKSAAKKAAEREDTEQGKSKYMDKLFEQAETRKKDQLRAKDKLLKREREAEGDVFADKEKFVTGAYKAQQEEVKKAEEEEKKRQEAEEEKRKKFGMQNFHKQMLMEQEKRHQEAVEAAAEAMKSGAKVEVEEEPKEKTDAELARELSEKGQKVVLNEEGQVVDRRELLQAGLNIVAKPKSTSNTSANQKPAAAQPKYQGRSAVQRGVRERQTQMIAEQIEQAAKRKAEEEAEELAKLQQANKSQKTSDDIKSAKERRTLTVQNVLKCVPSTCFILFCGVCHLVLADAQTSSCGRNASMFCPNDPDWTRRYPLKSWSSLSFRSVLEHSPQKKILKIGPWSDLYGNCFGCPRRR